MSPEPVARRFPVGEKEAQSIGDVCPGGYPNVLVKNNVVVTSELTGKSR